MNKKIKYRNRILTLLITLTMLTSILAFPSSASNGTYNYIIITTNAIVENSEELGYFIYMKELEGHSVKVVTESDFDILTGQFPDDRADKIRKWLIDNYASLGIDYVLLIGDPDPDDPRDLDDYVGDIPMKMCLTTTYTPKNPGIPTDLYFGDLNSNWDRDNDGQYCEIADPLTNPRSPDPTIHENTFSVEWVGKVDCEYETDYTFWTYSDDAVQVEIDGYLVIDNWISHEQIIDEATIPMTAGKHDINIKYREDSGDGIIRLYWRTEVPSGHSCYIRDQLIPSDNLYDESDSQFGLTGYYYDNPDHTELKIKRKDPEIAFFWGSGDKDNGNPDHHAEIIVGRIPVYDDDYVQLDKIIRKIIDYETDPENIDWRKSLLLPMVPMDDITTSVGLGEALMNDVAIPNSFTYYRIYQEDYGLGPEKTPCSFENTYNEWSKGYGMVTWHTHGGIDGASEVFRLEDIAHLDDSKPAFTFQGSCSNAWPESKNNLAYGLLKKGGIAMAAATRMSTYYKGDYITPFNPKYIGNNIMAYFYTKYLISDGWNAGQALKKVKDDHDPMAANTIRYVLYGEPDCYLMKTYPNEFPIADVNGPYTGFEGNPIAFDASSSSDFEDGNDLDFRWDFDDNGDWDTDWSSNPTAEFTWGDDFSGSVKVEVRDNLGKTDTTTSSVNVENVAPTTILDALNQPNPQFILPLVHDLTFEGSFTDPGWLDYHSSEWDFGDSTIKPGTLVEENVKPDSTGTTTADHIYSYPGLYTISLTVTDDDGGSSTDSMIIEVVDEFGALQDIDDYIQGLPDSVFKGNANQKKNVFHNMILAINDMLVDMEYNGAIHDLLNNIRAKADGYVDGDKKNDWITDETAQQHICMKIDDLTAYLTLLI